MTSLALAGAETRLLVRDKTTLLSATMIPLALAFLLLQNGDAFNARAASALGALQLMVILAFSTYSGATMSLAARRADLYLKRLRNSPLSSVGIVSGLTLPLFAVTVAQVAIVLAMVVAVTGAMPARPELLLVAVLIGGGMCIGFAFLTAAYTGSAQAAQMTVLPLLMVLTGAAIWTVSTPTASVSIGQLLIPGGGIVQLARLGWEGAPAGNLPELLSMAGLAAGSSLAVTAIACLVASRLFTWEPRT